MTTLIIDRAGQTAGTTGASPDPPVFAVVGYDGSAPARRALDGATRLLSGRGGGMEIVYVAHLPVVANIGEPGTAEISQSFDEAASELAGEVRTILQEARPRDAARHWHFQRRDGAISDQLLAVADELSEAHGPDASVVIVVGRSAHGFHHVLGSVPQALERHDHYPVVVVP